MNPHMANMILNPWPTCHNTPQMSQLAVKDHILTQLSLGHIVKQIYDKRKAIWRVNVGEAMA